MTWMGKAAIGIGLIIMTWAYVIDRIDWMLTLPCVALIYLGAAMDSWIQSLHRETWKLRDEIAALRIKKH